MLELTVGRSGKCSYWSIQEAIEAVPYETSATILVEEGVYEERLFSDKKDLRIVGEGKVVVTASVSAREIMPDGIKRGTFRTATAFFSGERLELKNLEIRNTAGKGRDAGQALALYLDVRECLCEKVALKAHQDTLFLAPLPDVERENRGFYGPRVFSPRLRTRTIFRKCRIEGGVDFVFGGGDALFEDCEFVLVEPGYVTAPSGRKEWTGLVFNKCSFSGEGPSALMRPWRPEGKASFVDCSYGSCIVKEGGVPWKGREDEWKQATFKVFGDTGHLEVGEAHVMTIGEKEEALSFFS